MLLVLEEGICERIVGTLGIIKLSQHFGPGGPSSCIQC